MTDMDKYLDSIEHEYGYMLQTSAYVCPGWMALIWTLLQEIDALHKGKNYHPTFTDIKEKYGTLRVYGYNINDETEKIIAKYARFSGETCMTCGAFGRMHIENKWHLPW